MALSEDGASIGVGEKRKESLMSMRRWASRVLWSELGEAVMTVRLTVHLYTQAAKRRAVTCCFGGLVDPQRDIIKCAPN